MSKRLAIIGCGAIAAAHALAAQRLGRERCQIVALADTQLERAVEFGQKLASDALVFTDVESLLERAKPDAVIICTPPATHAFLAESCLRRNVAVLCEKPLAPEVGRARELVELANRRAGTLRTTAKYRFTDGVVAAKKCLQSGVLGPIRQIEINFGAPVAMENRWQSDAAQSGGGVLMDNGPHAIDLARYLLGEVHLTDVELCFGNLAVEEEASMQLQGATGIPVSIELSWRRQISQNFLRIVGENSIIEAGWDATFVQLNIGQKQVLASAYDKNEAFARQLEAFLIETTSGHQNEAPWQSEDGLRAVEIIVAAYEKSGAREPKSL